MEALNNLIGAVGSFAWGPIMITLLFATGLILSIGTKFVQYRKLGLAFKLLFTKGADAEGDISPFQALMTSLAATIGTGNIARCCNSNSNWWAGCCFLDVDYCNTWRGNKIFRSSSCYQIQGNR